MKRLLPVVLVAAVVSFAHSPVVAGALGGYTPRVPVSPLGLSWFDPSRLQISSSFSVGTGFGGRTDALQVTRLSYQLGNPLWISVSLGNSFGPNAGRNSGRFFLEGFQASYRPTANMLFQVQYQDFRSPLQATPFGYRNSGTPFDGAWNH